TLQRDLSVTDEAVDLPIGHEPVRVLDDAADHRRDEVTGGLRDGPGTAEDVPEAIEVISPGAVDAMTAYDLLGTRPEDGVESLDERRGVPAQLGLGATSEQQVVEQLRAPQELGRTACVVEHVAQLAGEALWREVPWALRLGCHAREGRRHREQRAGVVAPDEIDERRGLLWAEVEGLLRREEVLGRLREPRPHRRGPPHRVPVVVHLERSTTEGADSLAVLRDRQIEAADAPGAKTAPVGLAGHALQVLARREALHALVRAQVAEAVDQGGFQMAEPTWEVGRPHPLSFEALEDPRQEDEVPEPGLDRGGPWREQLGERVPDRAQSDRIERPRFLERTQQRGCPVRRCRVEVQPSQRRHRRVAHHHEQRTQRLGRGDGRSAPGAEVPSWSETEAELVSDRLRCGSSLEIEREEGVEIGQLVR